MCTCLKLLFIFSSLFMTTSEERTVCPFVEILSFGSDFRIQCNESYLIIDEINNERLIWKFPDQTSICDQNGTQKTSVNRCGVTRMDSNYLGVPLKSLVNGEKACAYCRINYKSMVPVIEAVQVDEGQYTTYRFNITATGLDKSESFEILWAKRVNEVIRYSYNYWFLPRCIGRAVKILVNDPHTIIFEMNDAVIHRVEFILRRCNGTCRKYEECDYDQFHKEIDSISFQIPDSIEKLSCDSNCLNGHHTSRLPTTTHRTHRIFSTSPITTTIKPPYDFEQIIKILIPTILIGILLSVIVFIFIRYIICKSTDKKHVYAVTSNVDPDEHK